ncbi:MAG: PadR family transcriptional regulator [Sphingobium sp.]
MMKHRHTGGMGRHFTHPSFLHAGRGGEHHHGPLRGRGGGRRGGRLFDYGELRLLVLALLAQQPSHGYELIKGIEERFAGHYSPSPGVIYPTLSWLEDMGYTTVEAAEGARKRYTVTAEGTAFLEANRADADALLARGSGEGGERRGSIPAPLIRATENLKLAMRLRLRAGPIDDAVAEEIAAKIDEAVRLIEKTR